MIYQYHRLSGYRPVFAYNLVAQLNLRPKRYAFLITLLGSPYSLTGDDGRQTLPQR
jgi:hypothetical protein